MGRSFSNKNNDKKREKSYELDEKNTYIEEAFEKLIKDCDILLLIYILKTTTSIDNVMSVAEVTDQLNLLLPSIGSEDYFKDRTIRRKLNIFSDLDSFNIEIIQKLNKLLPFVMGGQITSRATDKIMDGTNTQSMGKQKRFYFEPVLSAGDMDLIWGSIRSNRFLSEEEKDYLLARLHIILPDYNFDKAHLLDNTNRHILQIEDLPKAPKKNKFASLPMDSSTLLSHIQIIHDAIENEHQIEVIYGTYDLTEHSMKVNFHPINPDKPYVLNPYAMMWNKGEYYLIATHDNFSNPAHFRVDRIISVKIHTKLNKNGDLEEVSRKKIPSTLSPFFIKLKGEKRTFDSIKYANTYPGMNIYNKENKIDVTFECTPKSLQILIDNFGPDIRLSDSPIEHSKDELVHNGKEQRFLAALIKDVQYDNAYRLAIAQSEHLTLLGPDNLVNDVSSTLKNIAQRYQKYLKN